MLVATWPASAHSGLSWLANILAGGGVAVLAAVAGAVLKDWRWRRLFSRHKVDPHVVVYARRGAYSTIIEGVDAAGAVDLMGISLQYALEYIGNHTNEFFERIQKVRVLIPTSTEICDARDRAQGTSVGTLAAARKSAEHLLQDLVVRYPMKLEFRRFNLQPYCALTRVDEQIWVSPYLSRTGSSSPVLAIQRDKSPLLFESYLNHFDFVWSHSS